MTRLTICGAFWAAIEGLWPLVVLTAVGALVWFAWPFICWSRMECILP